MTLTPPVRDAMLAAVPSLRAFAISLCGNVDRAGSRQSLLDTPEEVVLELVLRRRLEPGVLLAARDAVPIDQAQGHLWCASWSRSGNGDGTCLQSQGNGGQDVPLEFLCNPNEMTGRLMARRRTLTTALAVAAADPHFYSSVGRGR